MPPPDAPDAAVARWIRGELAASPPRARSLIVTVWGDTLAPHGGEVWLSTLIRLLAPFGVNERLVRTSVFRLARDGWLESRARGRRSRYRLTADGARRFSLAYRRVYTPPSRAWDGTWDVAVPAAAPLPAGARARWRDDLAWSGYAALAPGVYARPAPPAGSEGDVSIAWPAGSLRFAARDIAAANGAALAGRVDAAWALPALAVEYRGFLGRFGPLGRAFAAARSPSPEQAFVVRTLLVHEYRRARLRDPQLPPELLAPDWPGAAAYALCRDIYRAAGPGALAHLAAAFAQDGDALLPALPAFLTRFEAD
jgi:phenylacetic acid degradation operon negative regulatory protein